MNYELMGILATVLIQALYIAFKMGKFEEKLNELDKKVEKHNNLVERTYKLEQDVQKNSMKIQYLEEHDFVK